MYNYQTIITATYQEVEQNEFFGFSRRSIIYYVEKHVYQDICEDKYVSKYKTKLILV